MRRHLTGLALLALLCLCDAAAAQSLDPLEELQSTLPGRLARKHLRILGVEVGRDTLGQVEARLGAAARFAPGGLTELQALCYVSGDADDAVGVVFQADAGDADAVTVMARVAARRDLGGMARHCRPSARLANGVRTDGGIALGMRSADYLAQFLQAPSEDRALYTGFYFYQPVEPRQAGSCQLLSGIRAHLRGGRVWSFFVYRLYRGRAC